jgi:hypothetical protein
MLDIAGPGLGIFEQLLAEQPWDSYVRELFDRRPADQLLPSSGPVDAARVNEVWTGFRETFLDAARRSGRRLVAGQQAVLALGAAMAEDDPLAAAAAVRVGQEPGDPDELLPEERSPLMAFAAEVAGRLDVEAGLAEVLAHRRRVHVGSGFVDGVGMDPWMDMCLLAAGETARIERAPDGGASVHGWSTAPGSSGTTGQPAGFMQFAGSDPGSVGGPGQDDVMVLSPESWTVAAVDWPEGSVPVTHEYPVPAVAYASAAVCLMEFGSLGPIHQWDAAGWLVAYVDEATRIAETDAAAGKVPGGDEEFDAEAYEQAEADDLNELAAAEAAEEAADDAE